MHELNAVEIESVEGGAVPYLAALAFVWYEAGHIQSFVNGFFDGRSAAQSTQ